MGWYKEIQLVLSQEPETWLAYLHGQKLKELPHLSRSVSRVKGPFLLLIKHLYFVFRNVGFHRIPSNNDKYEIVLYAGTYNQIASLHSVSSSLEGKGGKVLRIGASNILDDVNADPRCGFVPLRLTPMEVFKSLILLAFNGVKLYSLLGKEKEGREKRSLFFNEFLNSYPYLVYFHRVIEKYSPSIILVSNDHSTSNRCLLAMGALKGVKTAYLQHASVSHLFPALCVDYAFLDGQCAADIYAQCVTNRPAAVVNKAKPYIYLTGQQKFLERNQDHPSVVGVATNLLDESENIVSFVEGLAVSGFGIRLRWHPRQSKGDVDFYYKAFEGNDSVSLSDPDKETVAEFMDQIGWLVAGNSSIHLEAALSGVLPIYFELSKVDAPDYYGYVRNGVARRADTVAEIISLVEETQDCHDPDPSAVRYYSASYMTEWEGREGERVADLLLSLVRNEQQLGVDVQP